MIVARMQWLLVLISIALFGIALFEADSSRVEAAGTFANSIAYIGCSNTVAATQGSLTGYFWSFYEIGNGAIQAWADPASPFWNAFDQQKALHQPRAVWVQLCEVGIMPASYANVQTLFANLRLHAPGVPYYVSAINFYSPLSGTCSLIDPNGIGQTDTIAFRDRAVADGLALRGPDMGPLSSSTLALDGCHPNSAGQTLLGNQLDAFFKFDANGNISTGSSTSPTNPPPADFTAPSAPTNLHSSITLQGDIALSWTPSTDNVGVTGYQVIRGDMMQTATTTVVSYTATSTLPGHTYPFGIRAFDAAKNYSPWATITVAVPMVDTTPPSTPLGATTTVVNNTSIRFSWLPSSDNVGVTGYQVQRNGTIVASTTATQFTDLTALPGILYSYLVRAFDLVGNFSSWSSTVTGSLPDLTPPSVPTNLTSSVSSGPVLAVVLGWGASSDAVGVSGYKLFRDGTLIASTTALSYTDGSVRMGATYSYTVAAFDTAGNVSSPSSAVQIVIPDTLPPSIPGSLTAQISVTPGSLTTQISVTPRSVTLSWVGATDNVGVVGYEVYRDSTFMGTTTATQFTDLSTQEGVTYDYAVRAFDASQNFSNVSAPVSVIVPDITPPTLPGTLSAAVHSVPASVTLDWAPATDAVGVLGYQVVRDGVIVGTTTTPHFVDDTVLQGSAYVYAVSAFDMGGNISLPIMVGPVSIPDTVAPTVPSGLLLSSVPGIARITLQWTPSDDTVGVAGYRVYRGAVQIATATTALYVDSGITFKIKYVYSVRAFDAAGNLSATSTTASISVAPPDIVPPTAPVLSLGTTKSNSVGLTWSAATDDVRVTGYELYRNGTRIATTTSRSFIDSTVQVLQTYTYAVDAYDVQGNISEKTSLTVTVPDTTVPTRPTSFKASVTSVPTLAENLSWATSTDNVAVVGYQVIRDGVALGTTTALQYVDPEVVYASSYTYSLKAFDAAGNMSLIATLHVTTPVVLSLVNVVATPGLSTGSPTTATIAWNTGSLAASATIQYGLTPDTLTSTQAVASRTSQSTRLSSLKRGTKYYYQIRATSADGQVVTSDILSFTTN